MAASGESPAACPILPNEGNLQGYTTQYAYYGRGNLRNVVARGQSRTFAYDSLSRLTRTTNPESGTICYSSTSSSGCSSGYDANGNVLSKTDARSITISYQYDALNRLISKGFSDKTLSQCFAFAPGGSSSIANGNGRLSNEWTQTGSCSGTSGLASAINSRTILAYDPAGRVTREQQCAFGSCTSTAGTMQYTYDLAGGLTSSTNGMNAGTPGIQFTFTRDGTHRLATATSSWDDASHPKTLFTADTNIVGQPTYGPFGLLQGQLGISTLGSSPLLTHSRSHDTMGRVADDRSQRSGGGAGGTAPVFDGVVTITPNPVAAGVTAIATATCKSCTTGNGLYYVDSLPTEGFTYTPGTSNSHPVTPFSATATGTHVIQVKWTESGGAVHMSPTVSFQVTPANSIPPTTLTATITPSIVPLGESGQLQITLGCTTACGSAQGKFFVDGAFGGGFTTDANGTATTYTSIALGIGKHPVSVLWFGNGTYNSASGSTTLNIQDLHLPKGDMKLTVTPIIGTPSTDQVDLPYGEPGILNITDLCKTACGGGQYFVDGVFEGGFVLGSDGTVSPGVPILAGLSVGTHKVTATYAGNTKFGPSTSPAVSFKVVDASKLPAVTILASPVTSPVKAQTYSPLNVTFAAAGVTSCGGSGRILVDGQYSDTFFVGSTGAISGNGGAAKPLLIPMMSGTHSFTVAYPGSTACAPTSKSFAYTIP